MVDIGPLNKTSPSVQFWLNAVATQDQGGNFSRIRITVTAINTGNNTSNYGGYGEHWGAIDGIGQIVNYSANPFLPRVGAGATRWQKAADYIYYHDANGNANALTIRMGVAYGNVNEQHTTTLYLPRIPKVPAAPTSLDVTQATPTSLMYRFSGNSDGGAGILEWQAQVSSTPSFASPVTMVSGGTSTFTGLAPGTAYYFRSRGRNSVGWGGWSNTISGTTLPSVPPGMSVTPSINGTSATVALTPPQGVSTVTSYRVERRPVGGAAVVHNTATSPLTVSGLAPGAVFEWRSSAFIGSYQTPWTEWVTRSQPNPNTTPGEYFDGSTPNTADETFAWTGTANNSTTEVRGRPVDGWSVWPGSSAALGRVVGGLFGEYAARATILADVPASTPLDLGMLSAAGRRAAVAEGGVYTGSIHVNPSRPQRMRARISWFDATSAALTHSSGEAAIAPAGEWSRLAVMATAPPGAAWAIVRAQSVTGEGFSPWLSGQHIDADGAMLTLGNFPYFDGSTPNSSTFAYSWLGAPNASESRREVVVGQFFDPLADPDCPPFPSAPQPPAIDDDCIDGVGSWRRYWAIIPEDQVSDWLDLLPSITITTGAVPARQVRIRVYPNPDGLAPADFPAIEYEAEQVISYIPASTVLSLDGVVQRVWASVDGAAPISADRLLYGTGGGPASWPILSCGTGYLVSFDVPLDAPEGNLSVDVALTTRML